VRKGDRHHRHDFTYDLKDVHQEIEVADGNKVESHQVGKLNL